jgi:hypothetical protein
MYGMPIAVLEFLCCLYEILVLSRLSGVSFELPVLFQAPRFDGFRLLVSAQLNSIGSTRHTTDDLHSTAPNISLFVRVAHSASRNSTIENVIGGKYCVKVFAVDSTKFASK